MRIRNLALVAALAAASSGHAGLVNHWTFDDADTSGLVANDTAGAFANNATWADVSTAAEYSFGVTGAIGQAVSFTGNNGANRFFNVANGPGASMEIAGTSALSISMWVQPGLTQNSSAPGIFTGRDSVAERNGGAATVPGTFWGVGWEANGAGRRLRGDSVNATRSSNLYDGTETAPEWFHIVFTWETSGTAALGSNDPTAIYVNGALDVSAAANADTYLSGDWIIGGDPLQSSDRNFNGLLDDLAVFDNVLSPAQVAAIYNGGLVGLNVAQAIPEPSSCLAMSVLATAAFGARRRNPRRRP